MTVTPDILSLIDHIKNDRVHGASELARQALGVMKAAADRSRAETAVDFMLEQRAVGEKLMSARPAMAPVYNIISRFLKVISNRPEDTGLESIKRLAVAKADELIAGSLRAVAQIARHTLNVINSGDAIMTHSYSSTVLAALREAYARYGDIAVITTGLGRGEVGEQIARQVASLGVPVTLIDEAAAGLYLTNASKILVGADRICADGMVINGVGTCQVAVMAKRADIPLYVLCETLKFDPRLRGDQVDLEERSPSEVPGQKTLPSGVRVKNPTFDITSLELVIGVVTENGLLPPGKVVSYIRRLPA